MFPRSSVNCRSGRTHESWACRRTDPVATVAPSGRSVSARPISASAASRRVVNAPMTSPSCVADGKILRRVHRGVGPTIEHGLLDLLDEHALAADHMQRDVLAPIAGRLDEHELGVATRGPERLRHRTCLSTSLGTATRGQPQRRQRHSSTSFRQRHSVSAGRTGRSPRRRCAHPAACRHRGEVERTARGGAWRRWRGSTHRRRPVGRHPGRPGDWRSARARPTRTCSARSWSRATSGAA